MKKTAILVILIILLFLILFLNSCFAIAGTIIIEGNIDRGEEAYLFGEGKVLVDVYAEGLFDVAAIQTGFNFLQDGDNFNSLFQISKDEDNPAYSSFDWQMIELGQSIPLSVWPIFTSLRDTAGFMLLSGEMDFEEKTLLYSVAYDYTAEASGVYTIDINPGLTVIGDSSAKSILYATVPGSISIVPEPNAIILLIFSILGLVFLTRNRVC